MKYKFTTLVTLSFILLFMFAHGDEIKTAKLLSLEPKVSMWIDNKPSILNCTRGL